MAYLPFKREMHKYYERYSNIMDSYQEEIQIIKKILNNNPKGMTVTDISRKIKINRNSVAKYLDIMRISGHVDMVNFGPAKVFFPSKRIPILDMLNYTSDFILVFDNNLKITMINNSFLEFLKTERESFIGQHIVDCISKCMIKDAEVLIGFEEALRGRHFTKNVTCNLDDNRYHFNIRIIPTRFEDGKHGASCIIKNITPRILAEKTLKESQKNIRNLLMRINSK
jgi:PAS domain-containing protein